MLALFANLTGLLAESSVGFVEVFLLTSMILGLMFSQKWTLNMTERSRALFDVSF